MAGEWLLTTIGACADFLSGGTPSKAIPEYWNGDVPWLSAKDMKSFRIADTEDHVTQLGAANGTRLVPTGTILLLTRGMTLLNDVPVCVAQRPMTFNQDVKALCAKAGIRSDYLAYALLSIKPKLMGMVDLAGHGTGRLNTDELKAIELRVPADQEEQRAIAHVLSALDDKIELNRGMIDTLEAIARAIFTSWFVDFDPVRAKASGEAPESICRRFGLDPDLLALFTDHLIDSELGEIPAGWEVRSLASVAVLDTTNTSPAGEPEEIFEHYSIPAYDASAMPTYDLGSSIKSNKYVVSPQAVLVSKLNPKTPRVWMPAVQTPRAVCSTEFMQFVPRSREGRAHLYLTMSSDRMRAEILRRVTGSTGSRQRAQPSQIATLPVLMPTEELLNSFDNLVAPLLELTARNREQSQALGAIREALLPGLLSGHLQIPTEGAA